VTPSEQATAWVAGPLDDDRFVVLVRCHGSERWRPCLLWFAFRASGVLVGSNLLSRSSAEFEELTEVHLKKTERVRSELPIDLARSFAHWAHRQTRESGSLVPSGYHKVIERLGAGGSPEAVDQILQERGPDVPGLSTDAWTDAARLLRSPACAHWPWVGASLETWVEQLLEASRSPLLLAEHARAARTDLLVRAATDDLVTSAVRSLYANMLRFAVLCLTNVLEPEERKSCAFHAADLMSDHASREVPFAVEMVRAQIARRLPASAEPSDDPMELNARPRSDGPRIIRA
jgi:hypothetical protein